MMLQSATLQTPKTGTSRMSKALPPVPGFAPDQNYNAAPRLPSPPNGFLDFQYPQSPAQTQPQHQSNSLPLPPPPPPPPHKDEAVTRFPPRSSSSIISSGSNGSVVSVVRKPLESLPSTLSPPLVPPHKLPSPSPISAPPTPITNGSNGHNGLSGPNGPPPKMAIPRRPVGKLQPPAPTPTPQYDLPQPSPAESWSSLLSAYYDDDEPDLSPSDETATSSRTNSGIGSGSGSGDSGSASARTSVSATASAAASVRGLGASTISSKHDASRHDASSGGAGNRSDAVTNSSRSSLAQQQMQQSQQQSMYQTQQPQQQQRQMHNNRNPSVVHPNLPPPPPKDSRFQTSASPSSSSPIEQSTIVPVSAISDVSGSSSPSRSELWRRRSHRSDSSRDLPDLKLNHSHGSTASTASTASQETIKATQPKPAVRGLPGRNVRPVPPKEEAADNQTMGNEASKLRQLKNKLHSSGRSDHSAAAPRNAPNRPLTPEYQKEDVAVQIVPTFVAPASPAASPDSPRDRLNFSKDLPPKPPSKDGTSESTADAGSTEANPVARKGLPGLPVSSQDLHGVQSLPEIRPNTQSPVNNFATAAATATRGPSADDAASTRMQGPGPGMRPPRNTSARPDGRRPMEQPRPFGGDGDPRLVQSDTQGPLYKGRDGTLYPEMKVVRDPHPQATYFPVQPDRSMTQGTVVKATALTDTHYQCYQKHRSMSRRTNRYCPITCQTCDKADAEDRWVCTFCHLRICESCMQKLNGNKRDLHRLLEDSGRKTPPSNPSRSRPGSGMGLGLMS